MQATKVLIALALFFVITPIAIVKGIHPSLAEKTKTAKTGFSGHPPPTDP